MDSVNLTVLDEVNDCFALRQENEQNAQFLEPNVHPNEPSTSAQNVVIEADASVLDTRIMRFSPFHGHQTIHRQEKYFPSAVYGSHLTWNQGHFSHNLLSLMCNLERYCNGEGAYPLFNPKRPKYTINISLKDAIRMPQLICTRTPYDHSRAHVLNLSNLSEMWCRMVSHYFEWTAGIPDLSHMAEQDRVSLCVHQLCKIICFTLAFAAFEARFEGLLFPGGVFFPGDFTKYPIETEVQNYMGRLYEVISKKVVPLFRDLNFTFEEYVLLKLVLFFATDTTFLGVDEQNSRSLIREASRKYRHDLIEHQKSRYPWMSTYEIGLRIVRMYSIFPFLEILSELDQSSLAELVVLNKGDLQGELTYDIHVRSTKTAFNK